MPLCRTVWISGLCFWTVVYLKKTTWKKLLMIVQHLLTSCVSAGFQACKGEGGQSASNHTDPQASHAKRKRTASPAKVQLRTLLLCWTVEVESDATNVSALLSGCCRLMGKQPQSTADPQLVPDTTEAPGRKCKKFIFRI